jgi:hypothetical protein
VAPGLQTAAPPASTSSLDLRSATVLPDLDGHFPVTGDTQHSVVFTTLKRLLTKLKRYTRDTQHYADLFCAWACVRPATWLGAELDVSAAIFKTALCTRLPPSGYLRSGQLPQIASARCGWGRERGGFPRAPLRPSSAGHGDTLRGVVLGVAAGAQHREQMLVGPVVGEMGDVQETVCLAATLADVARGLENGQPEFAPAGVVVLAVVGPNRHLQSTFRCR